MKVKGANFFELHIEKIVLVVVAVFFVAVLVLQLGAEGPAVQVNNQKVPLDQAFEPAETLARQMRARIQAQEPELPDLTERVDLLGQFKSNRQAPLAPRDQIINLGPVVQLDITGGPGFENTRFADLEVAPPVEPAGYSFAATIDPWFAEQVEGLKQLLPAAQPFDKSAVSVQATFDPTAVYESLQNDPDGDGGVTPWPITWYSGVLEVLGVQLERQRQAQDGSWGPVEVVPAAPGLLDLPAEIAEFGDDFSLADLNAFVDQARQQLLPQIRRPDFYPIIAGEEWVEPREGARLASLATGADPEVTQRERQLAQVDQRIVRIQRELEELGQAPATGRPPIGVTRPGRPGQRPGERPADTRTQDRSEARTRMLQGQLERLVAERQRIVEELTDLGAAPEESEEEALELGRPRDLIIGRAGEAEQPGEAGSRPLMRGEPIELWAHDVTAEPGATYRYRLRAILNNPAFDRSQFLVEEQRSLADSPTIASEPSAWTEPVIVSPMSAFFVSSGAESRIGALGVTPASAGIEVFRFFYGYYRKGAASLEPGDPVAAMVKLPEGLRTFDVTKPPPQGGPLLGVAPPAPTRGGAPIPPAPKPQDDPLALGTSVLASADAYLVDVVESAARESAGLVPGGSAPRIVTFGDSSGQILRRRVAEDRRSNLYGRLAASAEDGLTQGQPEPEALPEAPTGPDRPPPPPTGTTPPGGGGGGGG